MCFCKDFLTLSAFGRERAVFLWRDCLTIAIKPRQMARIVSPGAVRISAGHCNPDTPRSIKPAVHKRRRMRKGTDRRSSTQDAAARRHGNKALESLRIAGRLQEFTEMRRLRKKIYKKTHENQTPSAGLSKRCRKLSMGQAGEGARESGRGQTSRRGRTP